MIEKKAAGEPKRGGGGKAKETKVKGKLKGKFPKVKLAPWST